MKQSCRVLGLLSCLPSGDPFVEHILFMICLNAVQAFVQILHDSFAKADMIILQGSLSERGSQLQNQVAMNQQLMKRKEDMEWQLMSVLAQVWLLQY